MTTSDVEDTHVSSVFVDAPYADVWASITDPRNFPDLYPAWTSEVEQIRAQTYRGIGPEGDEFEIRPRLDAEFGIVDFDVEFDGVVERSRSRLFDVDDGSCVLVHLAVRWEGVDDEEWDDHKQATEDDLSRMKHLLEGETE